MRQRRPDVGDSIMSSKQQLQREAVASRGGLRRRDVRLSMSMAGSAQTSQRRAARGARRRQWEHSTRAGPAGL
jgi:hypothetical protein